MFSFDRRVEELDIARSIKQTINLLYYFPTEQEITDYLKTCLRINSYPLLTQEWETIPWWGIGRRKEFFEKWNRRVRHSF